MTENEIRNQLTGMYDPNLVEAAEESDITTLDTVVNLRMLGAGIPKKYTGQVKEILTSIAHDQRVSGFLSGASYAVNNRLESVLNQDRISDYAKEKDFCVLYAFYDNDFGIPVEQAARKYADLYNRFLYNINLNSDDSYSADYYKEKIKALEDPAVIRNVMSIALTGALWDTMVGNPLDSLNVDIGSRVADYIDYLDPLNEESYKIGTYSEVAEYAAEHFANWDGENKDRQLEQMWMNGEVLVMRVVNGKMKISIR